MLKRLADNFIGNPNMTFEKTINSALKETENEIVQRRGDAIKALFDQQVEAAETASGPGRLRSPRRAWRPWSV